MKVIEKKILRLMRGHTRRDKIKKYDIRNKNESDLCGEKDEVSETEIVRIYE